MITEKDGPEAVTESPQGSRLLTPQELAESGPPEAILIPVDLVDANASNPRERLPEVDVLAENIRNPEVGLLQPIVVRRVGERYEVVGGHRRLAAFKLLREREPFEDKWRAIPAVIRTMEDDQAYVALISAQVHSINWRPREQATALERLALAGLSLREIGERVNRTEGWASKRLRVFADVALSALVQTGRLSAGVAEELLVVKDFAQRKDMAERAVAEQWSQDKARAEVRALRLDRQITDLGRRINDLLDILSRVQRRDIPMEVFRDSQVLRGRLEALADEARGPRVPTIEAAEAAAGVTTAQKARAAKRAQDRRRATRASRRRGQ